MTKLFYLVAIAALYSCNQNPTINQQQSTPEIKAVAWKAVDTIDIVAFNKDIVAGKLTMDVGVYFPSNFDTAFKKVTLAA